MPLMPAPPMPTKCTAPSSASAGTGSVQAATSAALIAPRHLQHDVGQPLVGVRHARPRRRAAAYAGQRRRVGEQRHAACDSIQAGVRSASSTSRPPPASTTGRALRRCSPLPMGSGTKAAGQPDGGQLGDGHRPGPAQGEVGGGVGEVHALQVVHDHVGRTARRAGGNRHVGVLRPAGVQHLDARPRSARRRRRRAARFSDAAPCEPPKTSSVGRSASRPNAARASARRRGAVQRADRRAQRHADVLAARAAACPAR